LALCSEQQIEDLVLLFGSVGAGVDWRNVLDKAILHGQGRMAKHVVTNKGISARTFQGLPKKDQKKLNNPDHLHPVKVRNSVVHVASKDLEKYTYKIMSAHNPEWGILPPPKQNKPRNVTPQYGTIADWCVEKKTGDVILVTKTPSGSIHKVRTTSSTLAEIAEKTKS
jgi:hypothetical protein